MPHDTEWNAFYARRDELRRERKQHTQMELPNEFEYLTRHLRSSAAGCGRDHANGVAEVFGHMFGWSPSDLMRDAGL